uniref:DNA-directed RNA polymerase n=1 Tax=Meloidogyne incognita TaxID=6306 RepID=A0A914M7Y9_MELIC
MNVHFPQTYEAKAESSLLMGVKHNLVSPRAGQPLIAAIQDFITAGHLLTKKDTFLTHSEVQRISATLLDITDINQRKIRLPPPAIIWPIKLWTGKQLIELVIAPFVDSNVRLNLSTKNKIHNPDDGEFTHKDTFVIIRNNQLLCGSLDKTLLGSESKTSIFYTLLRDWGEQHAIDAMWRLARFSGVYLSNRGFSIGIGDVRPNQQLLDEKRILLENGYKTCDQLNKTMKMEKQKTKPDFGLVEELEAKILKELSNIRDQAGKACREFLSKNNTPLTMAQCGSKGSFINIAQMIALNRSLPHFECNDRSPDAKGFVENSFYSGLTPTEFIFHTMGGREGLVDTAVKTAETGYMQRRLVKCLEDLVVSYDNTVRTSTNEVVQFVFGDDGLDPSYMEARDGKLLDLSHLLNQVKSTQKELSQQTDSNDASVYELDSHDIIRKEIDLSLASIQNEIKDTKTKQLLVTNKFADELYNFICKQFNANKKLLQLQVNCERHRAYMSPTTRSGKVCCKTCEEFRFRRQAQLRSNGLSLAQIRQFLLLCQGKVRRAIVEPGTAVGAVAATSIGEPSTQMTLKTFHFAGVASMNITQGVPRIKEIINAVRSISTPIITVALSNDKDEKLAKRVKARIERTTLGEVSEYVEQIFLPDDMFVLVKLNVRRIRELQLEVTPDSIIQSICSARLPIPSIKSSQVRTVGKSIILVRPVDTGKCSMAMYMHYLKYYLPTVPIKGIPGVTRCVINADDKKGESFQLFVEGSSFKEVLALNEVNGIKTRFNNAIIIAEVLGIEAARGSIISEILNTMSEHGIELDRRHVMLLADLMTYRGEVLGITRNGLVKMKESVLLLASFERTIDHLYEAAFFGQRDRIVGVSECIIMGVPIGIGTGMFKLLQKQISQKKSESEQQDNKGKIQLLSPKREVLSASTSQQTQSLGPSTSGRRRRQASTSTAPLKEAKIEVESSEEQSIEVLPPPPPIPMHRQPIFEMPELGLII